MPALLLACLAAGCAIWTLHQLDQVFPPPLDPIGETGTELVDREGRLLRAFSVADGKWRLAIAPGEIDPAFIDMLIAYEDRRFYSHDGIDYLALGRATLQFLRHGRIISGASTLTMQLARLIEPGQPRSLITKLRQMVRALQIERRMTKQQILYAYLHLAPYGGNLEGVRAASLAWFGKEPRRLQLEEAALLVALPQSPERRRPDRHPAASAEARDRVLHRMARAGLIPEGEIARAAERLVPRQRRSLPALASHLADAARKAAPQTRRHETTLERPVQIRLEQLAADAARRLDPDVSVAIVAADAFTGEILAEVGSADYLDSRRFGWIGMTRQPRSPGSALKPFIYSLAFQQGLAAPETIISDRPTNFAGYRPRNFDLAYQGDVSVTTALQMSLNVPALLLLEAVSPLRLAAMIRRAGAGLLLPHEETPGLAIGLGGAGLTLKDLVQLYTIFPNLGTVTFLGNGVNDKPAPGPRLIDSAAAWQVANILSGAPRPASAGSRRIAYKTGTSYGYRDAWSVGFDGRHIIGVWTGSADHRAIPGMTGIAAAAPILFDAFSRSGLPHVPLPAAPAGALRLAAEELPAGLRRFVAGNSLVPIQAEELPPEIVYPPHGAHVELGLAQGKAGRPLVIKLQGGRTPFRLLANGKPIDQPLRRRMANWLPDGKGYSTLTVVDARGKAASVTVYVD